GEPAQIVGRHARVGVQEQDRVAVPGPRPGVAAGAETGVSAHLDDAHARQAAHEVGGALRTGVVHHDRVDVGLARQRLDAVPEVVAAVVGDGHDVEAHPLDATTRVARSATYPFGQVALPDGVRLYGPSPRILDPWVLFAWRSSPTSC